MFGKYFDYGFKNFITPVFAGILQYILYFFIIVGWLKFLFFPGELLSLTTSFFSRLLTTIILLPLSIIFTRMFLEFMVAMTKIAQNSEEIKDTLKSK